jgi:hypothetical protein
MYRSINATSICRRHASARLLAAAIIFLLASGAIRAQAQEIEAGGRHQRERNNGNNAGGGGHHNKHKPLGKGADPWWDTNGTTAGAGTTTLSQLWDTTSAFWNTNFAGTGSPGVWNNGGASDANFSAGTDATGSFTVTIKKNTTIAANSITVEEGSPTITGDGTGGGSNLNLGAGGLTVNSGALLTFNGSNTIVALTAAQAWVNNGSGTVAVSTTGNSGTPGFQINNHLTLNGGSFTFTSTATGAGGVTVSAGTLFVNNTAGSGTGTGTVTVNSTGTLGGSGTITGAVTVSGSTAAINAGATAGAVGTLNINNGSLTALTLTSSKFIVDMTSLTADQLNITGLVNLGTTSLLQLNIPNGTTFAANTAFVLINNDLSDAISGTFSNAPAGTDIIGGYAWIVSYTGGINGNDFVLTAVPEPSTWFAGGLALAALVYTQRRRTRSAIRRSPRA